MCPECCHPWVTAEGQRGHSYWWAGCRRLSFWGSCPGDTLASGRGERKLTEPGSHGQALVLKPQGTAGKGPMCFSTGHQGQVCPIPAHPTCCLGSGDHRDRMSSFSLPTERAPRGPSSSVPGPWAPTFSVHTKYFHIISIKWGNFLSSCYFDLFY